MKTQLYQIEVKNPEAFYVDFEQLDQSSMFFAICEFLNEQRIDVIELHVNWHSKLVNITYILDQRIKKLEIPNKCFIFSITDKTLTACNKDTIKSTFGLTDDFDDTNQEYTE